MNRRICCWRGCRKAATHSEMDTAKRVWADFCPSHKQEFLASMEALQKNIAVGTWILSVALGRARVAWF